MFENIKPFKASMIIEHIKAMNEAQGTTRIQRDLSETLQVNSEM